MEAETSGWSLPRRIADKIIGRWLCILCWRWAGSALLCKRCGARSDTRIAERRSSVYRDGQKLTAEGIDLAAARLGLSGFEILPGSDLTLGAYFVGKCKSCGVKQYGQITTATSAARSCTRCAGAR